MYHFFCYASNWYLFWTASYLSTEKGWESSELAAYTALPFLLAAAADWGSGSLSDRLVNRIGLTWGRRIVGITGIGGAGLLMLLSLAIQDRGCSKHCAGPGVRGIGRDVACRLGCLRRRGTGGGRDD